MESRPNKYILPLIAALSGLTPACGGSAESYECAIPVVTDAGNDVKPGEDAAAEADAQSELATRGQVTRDLVFEVMGYSGECTDPVFTDVPPKGELCRAIEVMKNAGFISGYTDGSFRPDDHVNRAEVSKLISEVMGYVAYDAPCLSYFNDVNVDQWYASYMGALCENGYQMTNAEGNARPGDPLTVEEWQGFKDSMNAKLVGPANRGETARLVAEVIAAGGDPISGCTTGFSDVADQTSLCSSVSYVDKNGIMTGYKDANGVETGEFGPDDAINHAQAAKVFSLALTVDASDSGCSGAEPAAWYSQYMNGLCDAGLIDGSWGAKASDDIARRDIYKMAWDSKIWANKKQADGGK